MLEKSSFTKVIPKFKGGDSIMKKVLGLCLMVVLLASMSFAAISSYSYSTQLAGAVNGDGGNKVNGAVVYDPDLDAVFTGQYFSGVGSRANILGWTMNPANPLYASNTPAFYIRDRIYGNGEGFGAVKAIYGASAYYNGNLYFISDRWGFTDLNMVARIWCPVNADSVSVTFPYVTATKPLYNVTGISSTALNPAEDSYNTAAGQNLWPGSTAFLRIPVTSEADGYRVILPGSQALVAMVGVYTDAGGLGTNFYTGGGFSEASKTIWCNTRIPGAPLTVYVSGSFGRYNPLTGYIELTAAFTPGTMLLTHVGQLQPSQRGVWKYDATTLSAKTGIGVFGVPGMFIPSTIASIITTVAGATTGLEVQVPPAYPITDQFLVTRDPAGNTAKSRLNYADYGRNTVASVMATNTQFTVDLGGKPYYGVNGVYTDANEVGFNFWSSRTCAQWVPVTDTTVITTPWGWVDTPLGIWTTGNRTGFNFFLGGPQPGAYVRIPGTAIAADTVQPVTSFMGAGVIASIQGVYTDAAGSGKNFAVAYAIALEPLTSTDANHVTVTQLPLNSVAGVFTNAAGTGKNFAANAAYVRDAVTSTDATTVNISWLPLTAVTGVWTSNDTTALGFNFYSGPGNKFTAAGVITVNTSTTLGGAVPVWVSYSGGTAASIVAATGVITLNGNALPGATTPVWVSYNAGAVPTILPPDMQTAKLNGNPLPGGSIWISYTAGDALSMKGGGRGGYWDIRDKIYAWAGGIDTTLSLGSAFIAYNGESLDNINVGRYNVMDTTGVINISWQLPIGTPVWFDYTRGNGLDVANNRLRVGAPAANTPLVSVGDTVYTCLLYQGGTNPYKYTGAGTANNRSIVWNPYGLAVNNATGDLVTASLFSNYGWYAYDASGNLMNHYAIRGSRSTVTRGQISVDQLNGDVYWADGASPVWKFVKSGAGLDTYIQEYTPFYLGAVLGTTGAVGGGMSPGVRVKTVNGVSIVYLATSRDNNAAVSGEKWLTVMRTNGTIDATYDRGGLNVAARGLDVTPDGTKVMVGGWAGTGAYGQVMVFTGTVPVELSRFESVVE
jgi:hypothetical protein